MGCNRNPCWSMEKKQVPQKPTTTCSSISRGTGSPSDDHHQVPGLSWNNHIEQVKKASKLLQFLTSFWLPARTLFMSGVLQCPFGGGAIKDILHWWRGCKKGPSGSFQEAAPHHCNSHLFSRRQPFSWSKRWHTHNKHPMTCSQKQEQGVQIHCYVYSNNFTYVQCTANRLEAATLQTAVEMYNTMTFFF